MVADIPDCDEVAPVDIPVGFSPEMFGIVTAASMVAAKEKRKKHKILNAK